jgi:hypothetical protein
VVNERQKNLLETAHSRKWAGKMVASSVESQLEM